MSDQTLHKCASRWCPGLPWRASAYPHPSSCNERPGQPAPEKVDADDPWPSATDAGVTVKVATEVADGEDFARWYSERREAGNARASDAVRRFVGTSGQAEPPAPETGPIWDRIKLTEASQYEQGRADGAGRRPRPRAEVTPYQRGNRDGLLSFAAACDLQAHAEDDAGDKLKQHRTMGNRLSQQRYYAAEAWANAARLARVRAEASPDDPLTDDPETPRP